jgi:hypothetical protein
MCRPLHSSAEPGRIYRGVAVESRLDSRKVLQQLSTIHQAAIEHLPDVAFVLRMPALDLRQRLRIQVEMTEDERSFLSNERAPVFPAFPDRDEVIRLRGPVPS